MRPIRSKPTAGWLSRDDRQILLLWLFFVVILVSSALIGGTLADGLRPKRQAKALADQSVSDGNAYTGSILFVSADGDNCWQRFWDNQTGRQWDSGLVSCEAVAPNSLISPSPRDAWTPSARDFSGAPITGGRPSRHAERKRDRQRMPAPVFQRCRCAAAPLVGRNLPHMLG